MREAITKKVLREGDTSKPLPYTIVIVANPAIESGESSGRFKADPISKHQDEFDDSANYINQCLFGELPNQREKFLADSSIVNKIRVVSLFVGGLSSNKNNSLIVNADHLLIARRDYFASFLARYNLVADVAFAISRGKDESASAWATDDDDTKPGIEFELDGKKYWHRFYGTVPGAIAMHADNRSLTAIHEFGHAASSYTNGYLSDLYVDFHDEDVHRPVINKRYGRPIPARFCHHNGRDYLSDPARDGLGYERDWQTYHCQLIDPVLPAIMDDYPDAEGDRDIECQHDRITRQFLLDRIRAKCAR